MKKLAGLIGSLLFLGAPAHAYACEPEQLDQLRAALAAERLIQADRMFGLMRAQCSGTSGFEKLSAQFELQQGRPEQAFARFAVLAGQYPNDADLASGAGRAALQAGRADEAFDWLSRATSLPGAGWRAWNAIAVLLDSRRDWPASGRAYENALRLAPDEAVIWNNLGYSLVLQGRFAEALPNLDRAAALDSNNGSIRRTRDLGYALAGTYQDARRPGESARDWARRLNNMGYAAWLSGDVTAARSLLARAVEVSETRFERAEANLARIEGSE